jgi:tetratricopeptide (TPR) repeat protein
MRSADLSVDFIRSNPPSRKLVVTFTELGNRILNDYGFGGAFLAKNGFDIIAIKSSRDDWHINLGEDCMPSILAFLDCLPEPYLTRATYGSSMGAYASIRYAKILGAHAALAISPQFDISGDPRWSKHTSRIGMLPAITQNEVSNVCNYVLVYDPVNPDELQTNKFVQVIPNMKLIKLPHSGHPSGPVLSETGVLKPLALAILSGRYPMDWSQEYKRMRGRSPTYLFNLARQLMRRNKLAWADSLLGRAIGIKPLQSEFLIKSAQLAARNGDMTSALSRAALAVALQPTNPDMLGRLADFLLQTGRERSARVHLQRALELSGNDPTRFSQLRQKLILPPPAVEK